MNLPRRVAVIGGNRIPFCRAHTAYASLLNRIDARQEVSANLYYLDEITWLDSSKDVPIARRLDLRYARRIGESLRLELIGQNLIEEYEDYESENLHDQVIYLRFSGGF